jgi:gas vesicle protein
MSSRNKPVSIWTINAGVSAPQGERGRRPGRCRHRIAGTIHLQGEYTMTDNNQAPAYTNGHECRVLAGMLMGAATGAVTTLLAPQSGRDTRMQIHDKGIELRDCTTGAVDDAVHQLRSGTSMLVADGRMKAEVITEQGQDLLAGQLDRVSAAARAGKKAVENA